MGIMISKTIGFRATQHFQTNPLGILLSTTARWMVSSSFPGHTNWVLTSRYFLQRLLSKFQGCWDGPNYCCDQRRLDVWDQTWTEPMDFEAWPKSKQLELDGTFWPSLPLFPNKQAHPSSLITLWFCFANSLVGPQTRWLVRQKSQPEAMVMRVSWKFRSQCHAKLCFH